jgi:hypothetical protein
VNHTFVVRVRAKPLQMRERERMAQAPLDPSGEPTSVVGARYTVSRRAQLKRLADTEGVTLSEYVRRLLDQAIDAESTTEDVAEAS